MAREMVRQGGRSARIQEAVHAATQALLNEVGRSEINVPMIAERAGVTPSTVYRRWGDLAQLLADAAAERLRPIAGPDDTGSLKGDLSAFVLQYAEEMPRFGAWRGRLRGRRSDRHFDRPDLLPHPVFERRALAGLCERAARALRAAERGNGVKYTESQVKPVI